MRIWLKIWAIPVIALVAWFSLSAYDISFGTYLFSREMHDEFLRVYASMLGVEEAQLPSILGKAIVFDGGLIAAFIAFRKRKVLVPWLREKAFPATVRFVRDETSEPIDRAT